MTINATPYYTKAHLPGLIKVTILVEHSLIIITISSLYLLDAQEYKRRFLKENMHMNITVFTNK